MPQRPTAAPPPPGAARYAAVVAYDGSAFRGFAANPGVETVAGDLDAAISRVTNSEVRVTCAGRTDAGVHAAAQVVSFDARDGLDTGRLCHALNRILGPRIVVQSVDAVTEAFDARFSATARTYRYRILNRLHGDPFTHHLSWHVTDPLDLVAMQAAADHFVGEHDFASFCRKKTVVIDGVQQPADLTRQMHRVDVRRAEGDDGMVDVWLTANAFCHQMVRAIVGTLVEVGLGKRAADTIPATIAARDRHAAGALAPPQGLTLWSVTY